MERVELPISCSQGRRVGHYATSGGCWPGWRGSGEGKRHGSRGQRTGPRSSWLTHTCGAAAVVVDDRLAVPHDLTTQSGVDGITQEGLGDLSTVLLLEQSRVVGVHVSECDTSPDMRQPSAGSSRGLQRRPTRYPEGPGGLVRRADFIGPAQGHHPDSLDWSSHSARDNRPLGSGGQQHSTPKAELGVEVQRLVRMVPVAGIHPSLRSGSET